ncbi:hypothetical protein [Streptomyces sp. NBC_00233]|uniref:hypothetical protein n=1 Tax=Streptomyces sp. NBC_00233 TaxID=2975686 RepID=UPI002255000B|nr:hypothetical protein [Streptomyces sp. NBC_00233]MCX5233487.1 hypothetical protein [Streptomyces sp. NBC_00233]
MLPLPIPYPAGLTPDATDTDAFSTVCQAAKEQKAVFIAIEHHSPLRMAKAGRSAPASSPDRPPTPARHRKRTPSPAN